jgi:hypothetical protein
MQSVVFFKKMTIFVMKMHVGDIKAGFARKLYEKRICNKVYQFLLPGMKY